MARGFLDRLLGRHAALSAEAEEAAAALAALATEQPSLAAHARLLCDLLPTLAEPPADLPVPSFDRDTATRRLGDGIPLLRGSSIAFDGTDLARRWRAVCNVVDHSNAALCAGAVEVSSLLADVLDGTLERVVHHAGRLGVEADLLATVLRLTAFPLLSQSRQNLASFRDGIAWGRGYCPVCGSGPLLGEFRGLDQLRFLRCGWCAASWEVPRLLCPRCGNRDHETLGHVHVEGEADRRRVAVCEGCRGYVKMVATLGELSPLRLLAADVATLTLDLLAAERGYG